jgi:hypothetical protein
MYPIFGVCKDLSLTVYEEVKVEEEGKKEE